MEVGALRVYLGKFQFCFCSDIINNLTDAAIEDAEVYIYGV